MMNKNTVIKMLVPSDNAFASVPDDNAGYPFDLNIPHEEDQEKFATIILLMKMFHNLFPDNEHTICRR